MNGKATLILSALFALVTGSFIYTEYRTSKLVGTEEFREFVRESRLQRADAIRDLAVINDRLKNMECFLEMPTCQKPTQRNQIR